MIDKTVNMCYDNNGQFRKLPHKMKIEERSRRVCIREVAADR